VKIGAVSDHRSREGGAIVYPVYSRRSRGLSVGINLFPDRKRCSFDCPYCEVFPFTTDIVFSLDTMKAALASCLREAAENGEAVKDICFSGNGEPTLSPEFPEALEAAEALRGAFAPKAKLVLITNGTGLLDDNCFSFLAAAAKRSLTIWLKLDAGTEAWYRQIDRSAIPLDRLTGAFTAFAAAGAPFTLQTMVCAVNGAPPPPEEEAAWLDLAAVLAGVSEKAGGGICSVQIYGKVRPAPEDPLAAAVPREILDRRAALLNGILETAGIAARAEVF
jgi:histidinol dehydrogenase